MSSRFTALVLQYLSTGPGINLNIFGVFTVLLMVPERGLKGASGDLFNSPQCTVHIFTRAECAGRRKSRLIESFAKYRYLKK